MLLKNRKNEGKEIQGALRKGFYLLVAP